MKQDRQYQKDLIDNISLALSTKDKLVIQSGTGSGKTVMFAIIAQRWVFSQKTSVRIWVHREELANQAKERIKQMTGIDATIINSETKRFSYSSIYIVMIDSGIARMSFMEEAGLDIVDEVHEGSFIKLHYVVGGKMLGFTATPKATSKKDPLNKFFEDCLCGPSIPFLISEGFLAQNITTCPKDVVDSTKLELDKFGEYNENKMAEEYRKPKHVINVMKVYRKYCRLDNQGEKTIIFNVNKAHSKEVCELLQECGYNARHLDSDMSTRKSNVVDPRTGLLFKSERQEIMYWFKITEDAILCNVMIATTGVDEPTIKHVILNYSTTSIVKFFQCGGRGGRVIDEAFIRNFQKDYPYTLQEKKWFRILDMGGNCVRFNLDWNDPVDWKYIFDNPDKPAEGIAPVKTCPECDGLVHASTMVCPCPKPDGDLCGYEFKRKPTAQEQDLEEMILITKGIDVKEITVKYQKKYPYYAMLELAVPVVDQLFAKFSPDPNETAKTNHFKAYYALCCEWWENSELKGRFGNPLFIEESAFHIKMAKSNFDSLVAKRLQAPAPVVETILQETAISTKRNAVAEQSGIYQFPPVSHSWTPDAIPMGDFGTKLNFTAKRQ